MKCYEALRQYNVDCGRTSCESFLKGCSNNCVFSSVIDNPEGMSGKEIAKLFDYVSHTTIINISRKAFEKIRQQ